MIETEINSFPQTERQLECCRNQARFNLRIAEIAIEKTILDEFAQQRLSRTEVPLVSDQRLLFPMLNPEQQVIFRRAFPNIDFDN